MSVDTEIDVVCDRFEAEWQAGRRPQIEAYLGEVPESARPHLLRELLRVDIAYRMQHGETLLPQDYQSRFPEKASLIATLLLPRPAEEQPLPLTHAGHYRIDSFLDEGGMGDVFRARDPAFGRSLAVKVLKEKFRDRPELAARFLDEAQITGQLQHPGIPPVHEIGRLPDGRPFLAMKLIKGRRVAELLAERRDPSDGLPRFLAIFAQVCQTLAYAHARRVVHRDLKPANVMVGSFGEVQVMDWGLAKVLPAGCAGNGQNPEAHQTVSVIETQRGRGSDTPEVSVQTDAGSVLGTPAYLAPEQARGEVDLIDTRADVFGLGAILCEILTGQPPFTGKNAEALRKAETAQLDDARVRLDGCGADRELIGLAWRCLAAELWDRPRDAGEVAAAVTAFQNSAAERLRQAELAHAAEVARTEEAQATAAQERKAREAAQARVVAERQARRLTLGLAASVLALVTVGAVGGLWVQRQRAAQSAEAVRQREAVETALDKARDLGEHGRWAEARAVLEQTRDRLGEAGPEDLRRRVEQAAADLALVDRLDAIRLKRSAWIKGKFDTEGAERDYATAFREAGLGEEGEDAATVAARVHASAVRDHLVAALDDWAAVTDDADRRAWLLAVARAADPDAWRDRFRDPQVWRDRAKLEALAKEVLNDEKQLDRQTPQLLAALGKALVSTHADAVPLLAAAQARHPDDFWLNFNMGSALRAVKKWDEAIGFLRAAVAVRPSAAVAHGDLGDALEAKGQLYSAIQEYRTAIALDPEAAYSYYYLRHALEAKRRLDALIRHTISDYYLRDGLEAKRQLDAIIRRAIELDPKFANAYGGLAGSLVQLGNFAEARESVRRSLERLLQPDDPLRQLVTRQLQQCEQLLALDQNLAAILEGMAKPANDAERLDLARLCQEPFQQRYATSYRLYAEAFAHDVKLADDMEHQYRYAAAWSAALAGCGQGMDADKLDEKERTRLRHQAVAWLRADLAYWTKQAQSAKPSDRARVRQTLEQWQPDAGLAGLRDTEALKKLPAEEREACAKIWADVALVLKQIQEQRR
jgi:serine/threonine-protein kinase